MVNSRRSPRGWIAWAALGMVLAGSTPAFAGPAQEAAKARKAQAALRSERARQAAQLDELQASDEDLKDAVEQLDANLDDQQAAVAAAEQAVNAAEAAVQAAHSELDATRKKLDEARAGVKQRAIAAYISPPAATLDRVMGSKDLGEAERKNEILRRIAYEGSNSIDELRLVEEDLAAQEAELKAVQEQLSARRSAAQAKQVSLETALANQRAAKAKLESRIAKAQAEDTELAASDGQLSALIKVQDALYQTEIAQAKLAAQQVATAKAAASRPKNIPASAGGGTRTGSLSWPTSGPLTSRFGYRWGRLHAGIDLAPGYGTAIKAADGGVVTLASWYSGYGNAVIISHGDGISTLYGHMSRIGTSQGASVAKGQVIGYVGSTGNSTGPHLHFEVRINGTAQNPLNYLP